MSVTKDLQESMELQTTKILESLKQMQEENQQFLKQMQENDHQFLLQLFTASQSSEQQPIKQEKYFLGEEEIK